METKMVSTLLKYVAVLGFVVWVIVSISSTVHLVGVASELERVTAPLPNFAQHPDYFAIYWSNLIVPIIIGGVVSIFVWALAVLVQNSAHKSGSADELQNPQL